MSIVSSTFIVGTPQKDGRSYVTETHTTNLGEIFKREYGPIGVVAYQTIANAYAALLETELADGEFQELLNSFKTIFVLKHQTNTQLAARVRARYKDSSKEDTAKLAYWILKLISDGTYTDTQVRNAFGLSTTDYTTLKNKMIALRDKWLDVNAAQGE